MPLPQLVPHAFGSSCDQLSLKSSAACGQQQIDGQHPASCFRECGIPLRHGGGIAVVLKDAGERPGAARFDPPMLQRNIRNHDRRGRWVLRLRPSDSLAVGTRLSDWDGVGADAFCNTNLELPARRATVWFATDDTLTMRDARGEATCDVSVYVVGSRAP